jgi:hypothetical protein
MSAPLHTVKKAVSLAVYERYDMAADRLESPAFSSSTEF